MGGESILSVFLRHVQLHARTSHRPKPDDAAAAARRDNFVGGMFAEHGSPYDGDMLNAAIEPVIGHIKNDGRLGRNYLKGAEGDRINAILSGCGYNMRKLVARLLFLLCRIWLFIRNWVGGPGVSGGMILSPV